MRVLLVAAGSQISTKDVENGYRKALQGAGIEVVEYALDLRIERAASFLNYLWRKAKKAITRPNHAEGKKELARPTHADVLYLAGQGVLEKALRFEVDFVLIISGMYLHPDNFMLLRRAGLRFGILFTESPYDDIHQAKVAGWADVCWTNERSSVAYLRQFNENTHYLAHAYDPELHQPSFDDLEPLHDVIFVGTGFQERVDLFQSVDWDGIDLGLYGAWTLIGSRSNLRRHIKGGMQDNRATVEMYRRSKIGLNLHRVSMGYGKHAARVKSADSLNPRAYELAACGVFQISDYRSEVDEVFGGAVPVFHDPAQLSRMIRLYLADDEKRHHSAYRAREAVYSQTFETRAEQVLSEIEMVLSPRKLVALTG